MDRGVEFVISNSNQPSAVPLPGALWLFVMGLLGLAGTRLTGKRDEAAAATQREGKHFELVDRGVEFVLSHHTDQPSAVPLPGALWLFVMGLLGLAGTRLTGKRDEPATAGRREPALPLGSSPVPA